MAPETPLPPLPRDGLLALLQGGRQAFRRVPRLRRLLALGFLLLYGISLVVGLAAVVALYYLWIGPWTHELAAWSAGEGFWLGLLSALARGLLWIVEAFLIAAAVVLSFLISLALMSVWFETLVARIIAHHRGQGEGPPFSLSAWARTLGRSLLDAIWLLLLAVLALALGFVPVVGPLLVVVIESYLLGRQVRDPYLAVRAERGDPPRQLRRGLFLWTLRTGLLPFLLALIPVAGWLLLPLAMIYLVAGFAWQAEQARATSR